MTMYLSYSGYHTYSTCPRLYWFKYINKPVLPDVENRVNSLFGTIVGTLFEYFYNEKIWAEPGCEDKLRFRVSRAYDNAITKETRSGVIKWKPEDESANYRSPEHLLEDIHKAIPRGLRIIRHHRFLGKDAVAEMKLDHYGDHTIAGRCDFVMRRIAPHYDLILLDGKGSKWRNKYVDVLQLKWYAMLYRMKFGHMPDRLGFVYWRQEPEKSVDWVTTTPNELDELRGDVLKKVVEIGKVAELNVVGPASSEAFPARPAADKCRFCSYMPLCVEGSKFNLLIPPSHAGTGVEDVGL